MLSTVLDLVARMRSADKTMKVRQEKLLASASLALSRQLSSMVGEGPSALIFLPSRSQLGTKYELSNEGMDGVNEV